MNLKKIVNLNLIQALTLIFNHSDEILKQVQNDGKINF